MKRTGFAFILTVLLTLSQQAAYSADTAEANSYINVENRVDSVYSELDPTLYEAVSPSNDQLSGPVSEPGKFFHLHRPDMATFFANSVVKLLSTRTGSAMENAVMRKLGRAYAEGVLEPSVQKLFEKRLVKKMLGGMPDEKRRMYAKSFASMLSAELEKRGAVPGVEAAESWEDMAKRQLALVTNSQYKAKGSYVPIIDNPGFMSEFEKITNSKFVEGNNVELLVNGTESFPKRDELIKGAKKSIYVMSWAFYDDLTGKMYSDMLAERKRQGIDVKVIVDAQASETLGLGPQALKTMEDAGVELIRYREKGRKFDGQHMKVMIVDGEKAIAGGMNFGDFYSHLNPDSSKWRDTDMMYSGAALADSKKLFADLWNEQISQHNLPFKTISGDYLAAAPAAGSAKVAIIKQSPGNESYVLLGILKAIYGATQRINIENAYLVAIPALSQAILDARARGVEVNILTNSSKSVDEPIVMAPILKSLPQYIKAGANVYLKKGDTLHSKFITVDGVYSCVMSYNLHPRSVRYEREMSVNVIDRNFTSTVDLAFSADIAAATKISTLGDLKIPRAPLNAFVMHYMFNQL